MVLSIIYFCVCISMVYYVTCKGPELDVELEICLLVCLILVCLHLQSVLCAICLNCVMTMSMCSQSYLMQTSLNVIVKPLRMCAYTEPNFYIAGNQIEIVIFWSYYRLSV